MKLKRLVVSCCLLSASTLVLAAPDMKRVQKDIRIMTGIFETASNDSSYSPRKVKVEATYLANQGIVFRFGGGGFSHHLFPSSSFGDAHDWEVWGESLGNNVAAIVGNIASVIDPVAPEAPVPPDVEGELAHLHHESERQAEIREQLAEMREALRDSKENYRDYLRELRELERESYHAEQERSDDIEQKKKAVEKRIESIKEQMGAYKVKMSEYREEKTRKYRVKKDKFINDTLVTLCDYSSSLRSVANDQHITLIFSNFANERNATDLTYVFKKSHLSRCDSTSENDIERLKSRAIHYVQ
ncbi:hypothetical protein [Pleionea sp. CnH1-48]|uniref:hypothetical protein n=1 Tax=Pleionea sp. CnH1-48 TaxID=2954494 RepID=UPI0020976957|nr:hypothetical protein [Pleionea sp. CnH1-48]MCO7226778.1 hypothetical protein [Pleionea sp. CnH1-48]